MKKTRRVFSVLTILFLVATIVMLGVYLLAPAFDFSGLLGGLATFFVGAFNNCLADVQNWAAPQLYWNIAFVAVEAVLFCFMLVTFIMQCKKRRCPMSSLNIILVMGVVAIAYAYKEEIKPLFDDKNIWGILLVGVAALYIIVSLALPLLVLSVKKEEPEAEVVPAEELQAAPVEEEPVEEAPAEEPVEEVSPVEEEPLPEEEPVEEALAEEPVEEAEVAEEEPAPAPAPAPVAEAVPVVETKKEIEEVPYKEVREVTEIRKIVYVEEKEVKVVKPILIRELLLGELYDVEYDGHKGKALIVELDGEQLEIPEEEPIAVKPAPAPKKVEEPVEEPEEEEEEEEIEIVEVEGPAKVKVPQKTFQERLDEADEVLRQNYSQIKNEFLSHRKVKARKTNSCETFRRGYDVIAKIIVAGKGLKLYLALDPMSVDSGIYHQRDASSKKRFAMVPLVVKIRTPLALRKAKELIGMVCEQNQIEKKSRYQEVDYSLPETLDPTDDE